MTSLRTECQRARSVPRNERFVPRGAWIWTINVTPVCLVRGSKCDLLYRLWITVPALICNSIEKQDHKKVTINIKIAIECQVFLFFTSPLMAVCPLMCWIYFTTLFTRVSSQLTCLTWTPGWQPLLTGPDHGVRSEYQTGKLSPDHQPRVQTWDKESISMKWSVSFMAAEAQRITMCGEWRMTGGINKVHSRKLIILFYLSS